MSSDGSTVVIAAPFNDGSGSRLGHVRVYRYDAVAGTWGQLGSDIDGEAAFDSFGASVAVSADGNTVIIGARFQRPKAIFLATPASISFDGSAWNQLGVDIDGEAADDRSGLPSG